MNETVASTIIVIGAIFVILGLAGKITHKENSTDLGSKWIKRFFSLTLGVILLILGILSSINFSKPTKTVDENRGEQWIGKWEIAWDYEKYLDNPDVISRELEFRIENDSLVGLYESSHKGKVVITKIFNVQCDANRIIGQYTGWYEDKSKSYYENGTLEFLMFENGKNFIGKFIRSRPNVYETDGKFRIWTGKKLL